MGKMSGVINAGLNSIAIFTIAACLFARAPGHVWLGLTIVFAIGALFQVLVLSKLPRR